MYKKVSWNPPDIKRKVYTQFIRYTCMIYCYSDGILHKKKKIIIIKLVNIECSMSVCSVEITFG